MDALLLGERTGSYTVAYDHLTFNVPEPSTVGLLGIGLAVMGFTRRKVKT